MKLRKQLAVMMIVLVVGKIALDQSEVVFPVYATTIYHLIQGALCGIACYSVYLEKGPKSLYPIAAFVIILIAISFAGQLFVTKVH